MQSEVGSDQTNGAEAQRASAQDVNLLDLLLLLAKRRMFVLRFTLATTLLAAITVLLLPSQYTAETVVLPPGHSSSMNAYLLSQVGNSESLAAAAGASLGIKNPGDMYVSLLRGRTVEDSVIHRFDLMARYHAKKLSEARTRFEDHSKVSLGAKDGLITISVVDRDPQQAAAIANGYVEEYCKLSANLAVTDASQRRLFFQRQLLEANENLTAAEEALKHTQQSTGVLQVDSQARSLIESAAQLRAQVTAKEVQLQGLRTYATEGNPDLLLAERQLAALQDQLARLTGTHTPNADLMVLRGNIPEAGMEYVRRLRDVKYYETISDLMAKQFEIAKLDEVRQGAILQVADIALPPDTRSFPQRTLIVLAAFVTAFIAACGWCIVEQETKKLRTSQSRRTSSALPT